MSTNRSCFFYPVAQGLYLFCPMAFKISNETKVGALTVITVTLFILGFNFLKGKNPLKRAQYYYARFDAIEGLVPSNPVIMNGLAIGNVYATEPGDEELNSVLVTIRLTQPIKIPKNSIASIKGNPLGTPAIEIVKGDAKTFLQTGDTIPSASTPGFFGSIFDKLGPTQKALDKLLTSLDSVAGKVNRTITSREQENIRNAIANLSKVSEQLTLTIASVNGMLDAQNGTLSKSAHNLEQVTGTLAANKDKITTIADNLSATSQKLRDLDLAKAIEELTSTLEYTKETLNKVNSKDGTVGMLLNDKKLYDNINYTINSLNLLMQDLRLHPKRYVNVSVFGKKDKTEPLMKPMATDSATMEQRKN
jgi:phospholipid/cholesterol/gamma-HCH transport system substrate-binding protein